MPSACPKITPCSVASFLKKNSDTVSLRPITPTYPPFIKEKPSIEKEVKKEEEEYRKSIRSKKGEKVRARGHFEHDKFKDFQRQVLSSMGLPITHGGFRTALAKGVNFENLYNGTPLPEKPAYCWRQVLKRFDGCNRETCQRTIVPRAL